MKAEVLVPRTHVWWAVLALAADSSDRFEEIRFVDRLTGSPEVIIVVPTSIDRVVDRIHEVSKVVILLWDGCRGYLEARPSIEKVRKRARQTELRVVGDIWAGEQGLPEGICRHLFNQSSTAYDRRRLFSEVRKRFAFPTRLQKMAVLYRPQLIAGKVLMHLLTRNRFIEYLRTSYVFCGQSGLGTLRMLSMEFGIDPEECKYSSGGVECDRDFLLCWLNAIVSAKERLTRQIAAKSIVRLIALRKLRECFGEKIFMNIYPEPNINVYQAQGLFQRHVFFEFGGINGGEPIYPRTADILLQQRRMLRFDTETAVRNLLNMNKADSDAASVFVSLYEEEVLSTIRAHEARRCSETAITLDQQC
jgi:hypothetical protein